MAFNEDIIVNIRYKTDAAGKVHKETTRTVKEITMTGNRMKTTTKIFKAGQLAMKRLSDTTRRFRFEMLGVMFFGMNLSKAFSGLVQTSMDWMGVNEILSSFLGVVFLPIAQLFLDIILALWDAWDSLPDPVKNFIQIIVLVAGIIGSVLATVGMLGLGLSSLATAFPGLVAVITPIVALLGGPLTLAIAAIIAIIAVLALAWSQNWGGIREATAATISWITSNIQNGLNFIMNIIQSFIRFFHDLWTGNWNDAYQIIVNTFNGIISWVSNVGQAIVNGIINGIRSMASALGNALWNILPSWLRDMITSGGQLLGSIASAMGTSAAALRPMAAGGIVTSPTPALLGEAGPEAIIPLDRIGSIGGIDVTINTTSIGGNVDALARELAAKFSSELARVRI